jgi:hypothetical protein
MQQGCCDRPLYKKEFLAGGDFIAFKQVFPPSLWLYLMARRRIYRPLKAAGQGVLAF